MNLKYIFSLLGLTAGFNMLPAQYCENSILEAIPLIVNSVYTHQSINPDQRLAITGNPECLRSFEYLNGVWLRFEHSVAGELEFSIEPLSPKDDIDFILCEYNSGSKELQVVRCMSTGLNLGPKSKNHDGCTGKTGLVSARFADIEGPGCSRSSENYLQSADITPEKEYYLLVVNFNSTSGFKIGSTLHTVTQSDPVSSDRTTQIQLFPNPARTELNVRLLESAPEGLKHITIFNSQGVVQQIQDIAPNTAASTTVIDIADLRPGFYILEAFTPNNRRYAKSFVKF